MSRRILRTAALVLQLSGGVAIAQSPTFRTPGMPNWSASSQLDRFSNSANPAFGALFDGFGTYVEEDGAEDGADLFLRSFEMTMNGRVDPNWWGYAVVVYADEEVELEEAAVTYDGWDSNTTVRLGRFFVDFGKQMQAHIHDLPYFERPGVLAEFLGEELPGVGAQLDHWWVTGDESALRGSLGLFGSFELGEHHHGEDEEGEGEEEAVRALPQRKGIEEFGLTGRLTQFMDVGERGVFQWGLSARHIAEFAFEDEDSGGRAEGLSNTVFGLDATYGIDSEDGLSGWTFGAEALANTGDIAGELDGATNSFDVLNDERFGYYLWGERRFDIRYSAGLLYSSFEHADEGAPQSKEITAYLTKNFSEFARLRVGASHLDDEEGPDSTRFMIQLTSFFGPHAHGVNW